MRKLVFVCFIFLGVLTSFSITQKENINELEKLNVKVLKNSITIYSGRVCYSGCQQTTPSDVCSECTSPLSKCPTLIFGSTDYGTLSDCSVIPQ